jgi:hypothetical protein
MTEPFSPNSSPSAQKWILRITSRGFASLLQFAGAVMVVFGLMGHMNFGLVAGGAFVVSLGFALRSGFRIGGTRVQLEDLLTVQDSSLQVMGDEIRSANGYSVRKLEDGIEYREGERILTIRQTGPDSPSPDGPATVQESVTTKTSGTLSHSTSVSVKLTTKGEMRWNPPHEDEPIPTERLAEVMKRIAQAMVFYESKTAGGNRSW